MEATLPDDFRLPPLREDLRIERAAPLMSGAPAWVIRDPARHRYFHVGRRVIDILAAWRAGTVGRLIDRVQADVGIRLDKAELGALISFLSSNELTSMPLSGRSAELSARDRTARKAGMTALMKAYLFFRVPLARPQPFLDATLPIARLLFSRATVVLVLALAIFGLWLVSRQVDTFLLYAGRFFSLQGAIAIGASLVFIKVLHELGHAYQARLRGVSVPSMGVAFMVMIPLFYTEVSDAWRLKDRRGKLMIDAGGVMVELCIAAVATVLWVFLPDGALRLAAFSLATTSWILSLFVNLNPFMRFDGYYFLGDAMGIQNLQPRAFALAKWRLRKLLFGLPTPAPERLPRGTRRFMVIYAWLTAIYRFFLFLGIALIVYHTFFKALGILLFAIEIFFFIALPILREMRAWVGLRRPILAQTRSWITFAIFGGLIAPAVWPMSVRVQVPAVLDYAGQVEVFPPAAGVLSEVALENGRAVSAGEILVTMAAPELESARIRTERRITLLELRTARAVADVDERAARPVLERELAVERDRLTGLERESARLGVEAPHDGIMVDVLAAARPGLWLSRGERLARVVVPGPAQARGYIAEADLDRVAIGAEGVFVPDDAARPSQPAVLRDVAEFSTAALSLPELSAEAGGPIPLEPTGTPDGAPRPFGAWFAVTADLPDANLPPGAAAQRGVLVFEGRAESWAERIFLQVARVLVRELSA